MKQENTDKTLMIMAGGTGGHVFPAIAVAQAMQQHGWNIIWLGTDKGIEAKLVPEHGFQLLTIPVSGIRGKGVLKVVVNAMKLVSTLLHAMKVFFRFKPTMTLGMGGYVSGPGGIVSWLLRKPLLIHEQNAIAGMTNRILAKFAAKILESYPNTFKASNKLLLTGNPVRQEIRQLAPPEERFTTRGDKPIRLLVLGGSQGAAVINNLLPEVIKTLQQHHQLQVWHQAGAATLEETRRRYRQFALEEKVDAFIDNIAEAYAWADIVICRAGATTIAELANAGLGSLLIPYPYAVDDHQTKNAEVLEQAGAGIVIQQSDANLQTITAALEPLLNDRNKLLKMALSAKTCVAADATAQVVEQCLGVINVK